MSDITRRIGRLLRANLGALLDGEDEPGERDRSGSPLSHLSDTELLAELERRRAERARRDAAGPAAGASSARSSSRTASSGSDGRAAGTDADARAWVEGERARRAAGSARRGAPGNDPRLAKFYAALECPYGSDLATVKRQYRALLRKYHPDLHHETPEKQKIATELTRRLTEAYGELEKALTTASGTRGPRR